MQREGEGRDPIRYADVAAPQPGRLIATWPRPVKCAAEVLVRPPRRAYRREISAGRVPFSSPRQRRRPARIAGLWAPGAGESGI